MISVVVPIYYTNKNSYIIKRIYELINIFSNRDLYELIVIDASKNKYLKNEKYAENIKLIDMKYHKKIFSPALARNESLKYAKYKYLFFFDVDLGFNNEFLEKLLQEVNLKLKKDNHFLMIPCFYLSKEGTLLFDCSDNQNIIDEIRESFLIGDNKYVERLAINTSAIILKKDYFEKIGMFSEDFYGHGGEDFELLHRLFSLNTQRKKTNDYYTDSVAQFVSDYKGFRKYMAYYSLPYLFTSLVLVHRWHERPLFNRFYLKRIKNENLLYTKMLEHDCKKSFLDMRLWNSSDTVEEDFHQFLKNLCLKNNFNNEKYVGLFKFNDNVKLVKRPISAKIRKLITRPKMFFKDIKILKNIGK